MKRSFFSAATLRRALNKNFLVNVMCIGQKNRNFFLAASVRRALNRNFLVNVMCSEQKTAIEVLPKDREFF